MTFAGERCFKLHRFMFTILGLWPYQKPFIWRLQAIFFFSVYFCSVIFQLTPFLTTTCNMDCMLKRLSYIFICLILILNYYSFYFNAEVVKQMLEHIQLDWKMFENNDMMQILEEYLFESYIFVYFTCICVFMSAFGFLVFECRPIILDVVIPMNESRSRKIEMDLEFFVDKEQYFCLYILLEILGLTIGIHTICATGSFLITIVKHCCATYKIANYLIQNTVTMYTLQVPILQRMHFMHRNICFSVYVHRRTMQFFKKMLFSFNLWYFPLLLLGVFCLSCILLRFYDAVTQYNDFYEVLVCFMLLYAFLIYMFMANFAAHTYTEHSGRILEAIYDTFWYVSPLSVQKLFLIMQKSIKSHKVVLGGLFVPSMEGISTILSSAISYFTLMHAMHS